MFNLKKLAFSGFDSNLTTPGVTKNAHGQMRSPFNMPVDKSDPLEFITYRKDPLAYFFLKR